MPRCSFRCNPFVFCAFTLTLLPVSGAAQFLPLPAAEAVIMWPGAADLGLEPGDRFARDHDRLGDVNGDGIVDFVVGARSDDDGATDAGAIFIIFPDALGEAGQISKISATAGGFQEPLGAGDFFGYGVAGLGDVDGDGVPDLACTSPTSQRLFTILLHPDGTVKGTSTTAIPSSQGLSRLGDLNGDGWTDVAVCNPMSGLGGPQRGAVHVYFGATGGAFTPGPTWSSPAVGLADGDRFGGREAATLGDLNGDGTVEVAVGAFGTAEEAGAVWLLSVDAGGAVQAATVLGDGQLDLAPGSQFGHALCAPGDLDGDGLADLLVGANLEPPAGALHLLRLDANGAVLEDIVLTEALTGIPFSAVPDERMGRSLSFAGDVLGNGEAWWAIGGGAGTTGNLRLLRTRPCSTLAHPPSSSPPFLTFSITGHPTDFTCACRAATAGVQAFSRDETTQICSGYSDAGSVETAFDLACMSDGMGIFESPLQAARIVCGESGPRVLGAGGSWEFKVWDAFGRRVEGIQCAEVRGILIVQAKQGSRLLQGKCPSF